MSVSRLLKALTYSTLIATVVTEAYMQIIMMRILSPGTVVTMSSPTGRRPMTGLELLFKALIDMRFSFVNASIVSVVLVTIVGLSHARLQQLQPARRAWLAPGGALLGTIAALAIHLIRYPDFTDAGWGILLGGLAAGGFVVPYLGKAR